MRLAYLDPAPNSGIHWAKFEQHSLLHHVKKIYNIRMNNSPASVAPLKVKLERKKHLPIMVTLVFLLLPLVIIAGAVVYSQYKSNEKAVILSREIPARISAALIREKLERASDMAVSLAAKTTLRKAIERGSWSEALALIEGTETSVAYIDNIALYDPLGTMMATIAGDPKFVGNNFSYRDYYQGVSKDWQPYVSEVYKRLTEPRYSIVSVAVPVRSTSQNILGIIVLTIKLDTFDEWVNDVDVGASGSVYIVDQKGHIAAHSKISLIDDIVDYSLVPAVQKVLKGESAVEILTDPREYGTQLISYAPIPGYGWGVIVLQPTSIAFATRNTDAALLGTLFLLGLLIAGYCLYRILRDRVLMQIQRDRETTFLESIGDGVVVIDTSWNIILWNNAASEISGWSKEEAFGKPFRTVVKFLNGQDRTENTSFIEDAMTEGRAATMPSGTILIRKDGSEIPVGDSAAPVFGDGEKTEGVIIVFRDTSKEIEKNHLRSDFAYASHQLRTPVTEALWNLELAMDVQDPEKIKEGLRIAHQSLLNIKNLSEQLVSVSVIDQGAIALNRTPVTLIEVVAEVQKQLDAVAKLGEVTISVAGISPLVSVITDRKLLDRILFEIIGNAVLYSPKKSNVDVIATIQGKELLVEVSDRGLGISEEDQAFIFTKFFRGSNKGSDKTGSGLGLYLAKAYITALGGKIWFNSEEGKGTRFFISLPVV